MSKNFINYSSGSLYLQSDNVEDFANSMRFLKETFPKLEGLDPFDEGPPLLPATEPTQQLSSPLELLNLPGTVGEQVAAYTFCYENLHALGDEFVVSNPVLVIRAELGKMAGILKDQVEENKQEQAYEALKGVEVAQPTADTDPVQAWEDTFNAVLDQNRVEPKVEALTQEALPPPSFYLKDCYCDWCVDARRNGGTLYEPFMSGLAPKNCGCGECAPIKSGIEKWKETIAKIDADKYKYPRPIKSVEEPFWTLEPAYPFRPFITNSTYTNSGAAEDITFTNPITGDR